jgi:hypothetical protein
MRAHIFFVPEAHGHSLRLYIDNYRLNRVKVLNWYPLFLMNELHD